MRKRKVLKRGAALLAAVLAVGSFGTLPAHAGVSNIVVESSSYEEKIDLATWSNPDSKILVENKNLVFPEDSTSDTRLITKTAARVSAMHDVLVEAKATLNFKALPENETFILGLGLSSIEALPGDSGNVEVQFTNQNGIKVAVIENGEDGTKEIVPSVSCGKINSNIQVAVTITKDGTLTLKIGGKDVGKSQISGDGEGRVGFMQTGSCAVKISDTKIISYRYDTPENCDVYEDFEKGSMNVNLLTSYMIDFSAQYAPAYAKIEELDGNQVLMCKNTGDVYLGTLYQYSNFEISFDIPYLQRMAEKNEEGDITTPVSANFLIAWGSTESDPQFTEGYSAAEQKMVFYPSSLIAPLHYEDRYTVSSEAYQFFAPDCDKGFSIKMTVIDTVTTVYMKWIDETKWTEVLECQLDTNTPLGYVQLWLLSPSNIAIDNFRVVNKDKDANLIEVEPEYAYMKTAEDYKYVKEENVYKDFTKETDGFNWYLLIPITAGVGVVLLGIETVILTLNKRKKGGKQNVE